MSAQNAYFAFAILMAILFHPASEISQAAEQETSCHEGTVSLPKDPGSDFVPFKSTLDSVRDDQIYGALFHRYAELVKQADWPEVSLADVPQTSELSFPSKEKESSIEDLHHASLLVAGEGDAGFFTGGAVLVSDDGLALTNYHIAEMFNDKLVAMTTDGKAHRVTEFLAGDRERDVALIRIEGENFPFIKIANQQPAVGENLHMVHHTEVRFYTYDRGYVKRYPVSREVLWMDVALPYAPGGSGCGIFNEKKELVGLVSLILSGDGPSLATQVMYSDEVEESGSLEKSVVKGTMPNRLFCRWAVPQKSIRKMWKAK